MVLDHGTLRNKHSLVEKGANGINRHAGRNANTSTVKKYLFLQSGKLFSDICQWSTHESPVETSRRIIAQLHPPHKEQARPTARSKKSRPTSRYWFVLRYSGLTNSHRAQ